MSLAAASASAPVPPPPVQETADCQRPTYATDQLVCADAGLRGLDAEMVRYLGAIRSATLPASIWFEDQSAWFKRRSLCAFESDHRACVTLAYRTRMIELREAGRIHSAGRPIRCDPPIATTMTGPGEMGSRVLRDRDGGVAGVAFPKRAGAWRPFLITQPRAEGLQMAAANGAVSATCRLVLRG